MKPTRAPQKKLQRPEQRPEQPKQPRFKLTPAEKLALPDDLHGVLKKMFD